MQPGLIWSIIGTFIISFFIAKILYKRLKKVKDSKISKFQIIGMCAMSFMHGAQDGQKFIGILVIYNVILKGLVISDVIIPIENVSTIIFTSIIMFLGVSIGGKKIVQNIGNNILILNKKQAFCSDIATSVTLLLASLNGIPVSTTHVKTMSIIGVGKQQKQEISKKNIMQIIKAWCLTFPICLILSYIFAKIF